ncbi:MAG TPA: hypothetical protein VEK08_26350 [Planctomycetota bacterium]|nr:hypothetical protein [Planctomycetota bacterium]
MPRPGYEANDDAHLDDDDLLSKFDPEVRTELFERLSSNSITQAHLVQLYRLHSQVPEERDADSVAEILDVTSGMDAEEFKKWIDDRLERWKDQ